MRLCPEYRCLVKQIRLCQHLLLTLRLVHTLSAMIVWQENPVQYQAPHNGSPPQGPGSIGKKSSRPGPQEKAAGLQQRRDAACRGTGPEPFLPRQIRHDLWTNQWHSSSLASFWLGQTCHAYPAGWRALQCRIKQDSEDFAAVHEAVTLELSRRSTAVAA